MALILQLLILLIIFLPLQLALCTGVISGTSLYSTGGDAGQCDSYLDLIRAPYVLYGVKYIDLVSRPLFLGTAVLEIKGERLRGGGTSVVAVTLEGVVYGIATQSDTLVEIKLGTNPVIGLGFPYVLICFKK